MRNGGNIVPVGIGMVIVVPILIGTFLAYDRLVWIEYTHHRDAWERDGRPKGYYFVPKESPRFATSWYWFVWPFVAPKWISDADGSRTWLWILRGGVAGWNVIMLVAFASVIFRLW